MNCGFNVSCASLALVGCCMFLPLCYGESASSSVPTQAPSDIVTNVTLVVALNTNRVEAMGPLLLKAVLENNSTNDVTVRYVSKVLDCEVTVSNASGELMPTTRFAKQTARNASRLGGRGVTVPQHSTYSYEVPVSRLYDMTCSGRYHVTAKVRVFARWAGQSGFFDIESVPVGVTVLRPAEE
jgi:hypothetical protein